MKAEELRHMEAAALREELAKNRRGLLDLRCQVVLGEDVHPHRLGELRKEVARIMTVLREKETATAAAEGEKT